MASFDMYGPNRFICTIFDEMRKRYETRNFGDILGLIEEAQTMANRMEAALEDKDDIKRMYERIKELKFEIKKLEDKHEGLQSRQKSE